MKTKNTIAILGIKKGDEKTFLNQLVKHNRLLIVSNSANDTSLISEYLSQTSSTIEAELINCAKEGCWEADVIFIWNLDQLEKKLLSRLQSVATQKIVVIMNPKQVQPFLLFPHSRIVFMNMCTPKSVQLKGEDSEALEEIKYIIHQTKVYNVEKVRLECINQLGK